MTMLVLIVWASYSLPVSVTTIEFADAPSCHEAGLQIIETLPRPFAGTFTCAPYQRAKE